MDTIHELKLAPEYFADVYLGLKTFELRKNDRDYKPCDLLRLREYDGEFTGRETCRTITYILKDVPEFGLMDGYVILGMK